MALHLPLTQTSQWLVPDKQDLVVLGSRNITADCRVFGGLSVESLAKSLSSGRICPGGRYEPCQIHANTHVIATMTLTALKAIFPATWRSQSLRSWPTPNDVFTPAVCFLSSDYQLVVQHTDTTRLPIHEIETKDHVFHNSVSQEQPRTEKQENSQSSL